VSVGSGIGPDGPGPGPPYSGPVATEALDSAHAAPGLRALVDRDSLGALVLAAAVPFLFIHERFQPELTLSFGSTDVDVRISDLALLVVLAAAAVAAVRQGVSQLASSRLLWISGAALLAWLAFQTLRPASLDDERFGDHVVTYAKLVEYSLLAICVPLLVRRRQEVALVTGAVVLWSAVATVVAVLQLLGLDVFAVTTSGWRYSSFLGRHDLAGLSLLATSLAAAGIVAGSRELPLPQLYRLGLVSGTLGLVLAGSVAAAGGFAIGSVGLWLAARGRFRPTGRQLARLAALMAVVIAGVAFARSEALEDFLRFAGLHGDKPVQGVESYSQRTVLAYIGLRIAQDNPVLGVGWQRSARPDVFEPYVDDARRRFPDVVELAFPAEGREWGVQNLYVQMLADAGAIGLLLLVLVGASAVVLAWRAAARAPTPWAAGTGLVVVCALLTLAAEWASLGIVPGIPLQAATCLLLGLAAAGAASTASVDG
jgi:O-Antigen ligase